MIHIENKSGKSYPIVEMSNIHLERTVDVFLHKIEAINATAERNPRYTDDIERALTTFAPYLMEANMRTGIMNPIKKQRFENEYFKYRERRELTSQIR